MKRTSESEALSMQAGEDERYPRICEAFRGLTGRVIEAMLFVRGKQGLRSEQSIKELKWISMERKSRGRQKPWI